MVGEAWMGVSLSWWRETRKMIYVCRLTRYATRDRLERRDAYWKRQRRESQQPAKQVMVLALNALCVLLFSRLWPIFSFGTCDTTPLFF